jgi:DNA helicase-2/ATP-dependent DNA helicase PcrA
VLTPTPELSAAYFEGLDHGDVPRLRLVLEQDFTFAPGVEVTEIEQVKGLEFDYVVVVDVTDDHFPDSAPARRRFHVAATRAVHQLWITSVGTPSGLLDVAR